MEQVFVKVPLDAGIFEFLRLLCIRGELVPGAVTALVEVVVVKEIVALLPILEKLDLIFKMVFLELSIVPCR